MTPVTLADWQLYVAALPDAALFEQAVGANSLAFVDSLRDDGMPMADILGVLLAFVNELTDRDLALPVFSGAQYLSYSDLMKASAGGI